MPDIYDSASNVLNLPAGAQPQTVAGTVLMGLNDRRVLPVRMDRLGGLALASHRPVFAESFEGGTVHPLRCLVTNTTMAATQSSVAGLTINSGSITTVNTGYMLQTVKRFIKQQRSPIQLSFRLRLVHYNNSVAEFGFGDATTFNGAHTTGAYFSKTSGGALVPVVRYNSVDTIGTDMAEGLDPASYYTYDVIVDDDEVVFVVTDASTGYMVKTQCIKLPAARQRQWSSSGVPGVVRLYNTGSAPATAPQLLLSDVYGADLDANLNMPFAHVQAAMNRGFVDHPLTGAQLAQYGNSAEPSSATLSNTAAGYTTLGGKFQFAAVAGAVTDYALFGFQVPAPNNLLITGIDIESWNLGAAVATTPHLLTWALGVGNVAVSLASGVVTRVGLGAQSFPIGAVVGALADRRISKQFQTPVFVGAGRFVHLILRMPVATATGSQIIAGMANFEGHFI